MSQSFIIPALALGALLLGAASVAAAPAAQVEIVAPDESGGLWLSAKDHAGRLFLRYCAPARPDRCTPWAAADLEWGERITGETRVRPKGDFGMPLVLGPR
jgi:hypothetical protein